MKKLAEAFREELGCRGVVCEGGRYFWTNDVERRYPIEGREEVRLLVDDPGLLQLIDAHKLVYPQIRNEVRASLERLRSVKQSHDRPF